VPTSSASVAAPLTAKARRLLRARGHHLRPVILVGKESLSDAILQATGTALFDHELVKVKLGENAEGDRHALAEDLARRSGAELVGLIGRTFLLYRERPEPKKPDAKQKQSAKQSAGKVSPKTAYKSAKAAPKRRPSK
jgi:RNA-binding protein